jgi:hypothetical protein
VPSRFVAVSDNCNDVTSPATSHDFDLLIVGASSPSACAIAALNADCVSA